MATHLPGVPHYANRTLAVYSWQMSSRKLNNREGRNLCLPCINIYEAVFFFLFLSFFFAVLIFCQQLCDGWVWCFFGFFSPIKQMSERRMWRFHEGFCCWPSFLRLWIDWWNQQNISYAAPHRFHLDLASCQEQMSPFCASTFFFLLMCPYFKK